MRVFCLAVALCCLAAPNAHAGDLKMRFVYGGDTAPEQEPVNVNKDVAFCGQFGLLQEGLVVNPDNRGIKNIIVYVFTGRGGSKLDSVEPSSETHTLANDQCRFEPHVLVTQAGDTLKVTNPDDVGHNANIGFFNNTQVNFTIPAKQEKSVALEKPEPAPIPVECNIHPWMKAFVLVLDHPYAAVTNDDGELVIKDLPEQELTFRVYHENGRLGEVIINGKTEKWRRNRFEVDIQAGENDMGEIVVPADAFR